MHDPSADARIQETGIPEIPVTLTKNEAKTQLHCSMQTIDRMIARGNLRAYKISNRKILIDAGDVAAFFAKPSNFRVID